MKDENAISTKPEQPHKVKSPFLPLTTQVIERGDEPCAVHNDDLTSLERKTLIKKYQDSVKIASTSLENAFNFIEEIKVTREDLIQRIDLLLE